eukprot:TRINITY_DN8645_c1_g1_i5.p1 TRINITY_DN8645_c1_g1~~TRINITY_DN8645_c1_g1_i5.p1  ORF type:complete len:130 (+),score=12.85 TRINITY_DN8645_c1_g1_i5:160-549(+)
MAATPSQLTQWFESAQPTSSKGVNLEVLGNGCTMDTEAYTFPPSFLLQLWSICNWNYELFANDVHKATDLIGHQVEYSTLANQAYGKQLPGPFYANPPHHCTASYVYISEPIICTEPLTLAKQKPLYSL